MLGRTAIGLSINQSINQQIHLPSNWLNRIQIKDYQKYKKFVYRLSYSVTCICNYKMAAVICNDKN